MRNPTHLFFLAVLTFSSAAPAEGNRGSRHSVSPQRLANARGRLRKREPKPYCGENVQERYDEIRKAVDAQPALPAKAIDWDKLYREMEVADAKNQMSCTGHSVARALRLFQMKSGSDFVPSAEHLYDVGASYFGLLSSGELTFPLTPSEKIPAGEAKDRLEAIQQRYAKLEKASKEEGFKYPASATILVLDYATRYPIHSRDNYKSHFAGWQTRNPSMANLAVIDFPPLENSLRGDAAQCFENSKGQRLKTLKEFSGTDSHLSKFDFSLVDKGLEKRNFPILDINTDRISIQKDGFVSYAAGGSVGHSLVIVGKGREGDDDYYEVLDSWADEQEKMRDPKFVMKTFKIKKSDLVDKVIHFSLIASAKVKAAE